jgi:serine phosphatase RsbU (regulator of sigma subunit)
MVVRIDKTAEILEYVNAGHMPMICRSQGVSRQHGILHRPWLGFGSTIEVTPTQLPFRVGDELLIYTDGIVEERGEPINESIDKLMTSLSDTWSLNETVNELINRRLQQRTERTVDDDIAIVAICRTSL